jgi:hypothetical protein
LDQSSKSGGDEDLQMLARGIEERLESLLDHVFGVDPGR